MNILDNARAAIEVLDAEVASGSFPMYGPQIEALRALISAYEDLSEDKWEYSRMNGLGDVCEPDANLAEARERAALSVWAGGYRTVVRRRRASDWEKVEEE